MNVSHKRHIDNVLVEKILQFKFTAAQSVCIQQAMRGVLLPFVLLERTAIFIHEKDNGVQDRPRTGHCRGEVRDGSDHPTSHL
jgi:hypothetical protein